VSSKTKKRTALIVTGEASGDLHGGNLIEAARRIDPDLFFYGVGGPRMREAGCKILIPAEELAVMGLIEVFGHLPTLWRAFRKLKALLRGENRPDVLILIDFQEFNLLLARAARRAGVPVLFYVGPTVWAWRRGRVKQFARAVDRLAVIFPFEPDYYLGEDIDVEYVGHPLLDEVRVTQDKNLLLQKLGLRAARPVVGLFPGSRKSELKYNLPTILETATLIRDRLPEVQFVMPVAPSFDVTEIHRLLGSNPLSIQAVQESVYDIANACDAVLTVSGTVTLQVALVGTPMTILYKMAPLTYAVGRRVVKVSHIGLVNIVAGRQIVKEFIQQEATAENLAAEILKILQDSHYNRNLREELDKVRGLMGEAGCSGRVARMAVDLSHGSSSKEQ
jgi:lipid-A-disaccharide synthase